MNAPKELDLNMTNSEAFNISSYFHSSHPHFPRPHFHSVASHNSVTFASSSSSFHYGMCSLRLGVHEDMNPLDFPILLGRSA